MTTKFYGDHEFERGRGGLAARFTIQYVKATVAFGDLGSGASGTINMEALPAGSIPLGFEHDIQTAWTVGGGSSTGLTITVGDGTDVDAYYTNTDVVGESAGLSISDLATTPVGMCVLESTALVPVITFTATGGTPDLDHVDGGKSVFRLYYITGRGAGLSG